MAFSSSSERSRVPDKTLAVQAEIRRNAQDYRSLVADIADWSAATGANVTTKTGSPEKPATVESAAKPVTPAVRIRGTDYAAWEKLDVNALLKEEEEKNETTASAKPSARDSDRVLKKNKQLAEVEKDAGNLFFRKQKYAKAVEHYTRAIKLDPKCPAYLTNRALALFKMGNMCESERDCTDALNLDPQNVKALFRRATARAALQNPRGALADLDCALKYEPQNASLKDERNRIVELVPKRRKLVVREINAGQARQPGPEVELSAGLKSALAANQEPQIKITLPTSTDTKEANNGSPNVIREIRSTPINSSASKPTLLNQPPVNARDTLRTQVTSSNSANMKIVTVAQDDIILKEQCKEPAIKIDFAAKAETNESLHEASKITVPKYPAQYSHEFVAVMSKLGCIKMQTEYLLIHPPRLMYSLFEHTGLDVMPLSICIQVLDQISSAWPSTESVESNKESAKAVYNYAYHLSRNARFGVAWVLVAKEVRRAAERVISKLHAAFSGDSSACAKVEQLAALYK